MTPVSVENYFIYSVFKLAASKRRERQKVYIQQYKTEKFEPNEPLGLLAMGVTSYGSHLPSKKYKLRHDDVQALLLHAKDSDGDEDLTINPPNTPLPPVPSAVKHAKDYLCREHSE